MGYQFEVDHPVPDDFPGRNDMFQVILWRKKNAPFTELMITSVAELLDQIGWNTEVGKILNDTGTLTQDHIEWLMQQRAFMSLSPALHKVFQFAVMHGYDVKVINPGVKADAYRNTPLSAS